MRQRSRSARFLAVWLGLTVSIGCGQNSDPPTVPVSGAVNLDGQPLTEGFLYFKTIETGALERFPIANGEFKGNAQVGTRRVEIYANLPKTIEIDGVDVAITENVIHPSFNTNSTLTAPVSSAGPNRFQFDVHKK